MYLLTATTSTFEVKLGGAITTNQLPWTTSMADVSTSDQSVSALVASEGNTNSGTAVTIGAAPASSHTRTLKTFSLQNADTASATATVRRNDNGTFTNIVVFALDVGDNLNYDDNRGWYVVSSAGNLKTSLTGAGSGTVTHTAGGLTLNQLVYGNGTADIKVVAATDGQIPIGKSSDGTAAFATLTAGTGGSVTNAANAVTVGPSTNTRTRAIQATVNGGGSPPSTGIFADAWVPYGCTITAASMQADVSGSAVIDIWVNTSSTAAPTIANTITASDLPTLSSAIGSRDTTLTGWTTAIAANSWVRFNLNSVTTCSRVQVTLTVTTT